MTTEERFKAVVHCIIDRGMMPTPRTIIVELDVLDRNTKRAAGGYTLNGKRCRWRREVLESRGFVFDGQRWTRPTTGQATSAA